MNRSIKIKLALVITLAIIAGILIYTKKNNTFSSELKDFAVKDTTSITKIFLADRMGNKTTLARNPIGGWNVNGKYKARIKTLGYLLETISKIEVKSPLPKNAINNILKEIATKGIKCEIYVKNELTKTFYVGGGDMEGTGTYVMMEGSSVPFITFIPGFEGYLTPRFYADENVWRDTKFFDIKPNEIAEFSVNYYQKPDASFKIAVDKKFNVNLYAMYPKEMQVVCDTPTVKEYLTMILGVGSEGFISKKLNAKKDSLLKTQAVHTVILKKKNGELITIKTYPIKAQAGTLDREGKPLLYDLDNMFAIINDKEFTYIQFYTFDVILKPLQFFTIGKDVLLKTS